MEAREDTRVEDIKHQREERGLVRSLDRRFVKPTWVHRSFRFLIVKDGGNSVRPKYAAYHPIRWWYCVKLICFAASR